MSLSSHAYSNSPVSSSVTLEWNSRKDCYLARFFFFWQDL